MKTEIERHAVSPEHAPKFLEWIADRGGVAVWNSINLSNFLASWSTPARNLDGSPAQKPTWQAANTPSRIITDAAEVDVIMAREVKRFHVGIKQGDGFAFVVTDGGTRRIRREVAKAGDEAWHEFDYYAQDAVILVPDKTVPLPEWAAQKNGGSNGQ